MPNSERSASNSSSWLLHTAIHVPHRDMLRVHLRHKYLPPRISFSSVSLYSSKLLNTHITNTFYKCTLLHTPSLRPFRPPGPTCVSFIPISNTAIRYLTRYTST